MLRADNNHSNLQNIPPHYWEEALELRYNWAAKVYYER